MSQNPNVQVKESKISGAGRGLFARKAFSPGDVVLSLDRPLVAELNTERLADTCAWCFQRSIADPNERAQAAAMGLPGASADYKSCTGCRRVGYCSKSCQSKAWKREHKYECKILAPATRSDLPPGVRAVIKLLGRLKASPDAGAEVLDILDFLPFSRGRGLDQFVKRDKQSAKETEYLAHAAWEYSGKPEEVGNAGAARSVAMGLMCNILQNSVDDASPFDNLKLGSRFDPLLCSANHSCEPNVVEISSQPGAVLRALKPIAEGDELFREYIEVTDPFPLRQILLQRKYGFTCHCPKCSKGLSGDEPLQKPAADLSPEFCRKANVFIKKHQANLPETADISQRRLAALHAEADAAAQDSVKDPARIKEGIALCINSGLWTLARQPVPRLCNRLFATYMESVDVYRAFRLGVKIFFDIHPQLYPLEFYPDRLIHAWTLSTVTNVLCGPTHEEIYQELEKSGLPLRIVYLGFLFYLYDNIALMYGWNSPLGKVVKSTFEQITAGLKISEADIRAKIKDVWPTLEAYGRGVDILNL